ncbi:hypothetical protein ACFRAU_15160 [Arthrobacter sp. NPDC056691]|uniref:hypothetical protein n=1 Tax=Arthrobacter sp. NPDC056691 TaxID=3345913 RepID=UPI00366C1A3D
MIDAGFVMGDSVVEHVPDDDEQRVSSPRRTECSGADSMVAFVSVFFTFGVLRAFPLRLEGPDGQLQVRDVLTTGVDDVPAGVGSWVR